MDFALSQNYPNPFNPTTNIKYALPVESKLTMEIYNVIGQRVRTLVNDVQVAGYHVAEWDGTGNGGQQLASGVYFLQISAKGVNGKSFNDVRKLVMMK
jgi:flagellar hook assembly protein FlgD